MIDTKRTQQRLIQTLVASFLLLGIARCQVALPPPAEGNCRQVQAEIFSQINKRALWACLRVEWEGIDDNDLPTQIIKLTEAGRLLANKDGEYTITPRFDLPASVQGKDLIYQVFVFDRDMQSDDTQDTLRQQLCTDGPMTKSSFSCQDKVLKQNRGCWFSLRFATNSNDTNGQQCVYRRPNPQETTPEPPKPDTAEPPPIDEPALPEPQVEPPPPPTDAGRPEGTGPEPPPPSNNAIQHGDGTWSFGIGSTEDDQITSVAVDTQGDIYIAGIIKGEVLIGSMPINTKTNKSSVFICKIAKNGIPIWAQTYNYTGIAKGPHIATRTEKSIYITGSYKGEISLDGSMQKSGNGLQSYLLKVDSGNGQISDTKIFSGTGDTEACGLTVDDKGNVAVIGHFTNELKSHGLASHGQKDIFVIGFDPKGNNSFTKSFGGPATDISCNISPHGGGFSLLGSFEGAIEFQLKEGPIKYTSKGSTDIVVIQMTLQGRVTNAVKAGGANSDGPTGPSQGGIIGTAVTGTFQSAPADFGDKKLNPKNGTGVFVGRLDARGTWGWAVQIEGIGQRDVVGIASMTSRYALAGTFKGRLTAGPHTVTSQGGQDVFIAYHPKGSGAFYSLTGHGGKGDQTARAIARIPGQEDALVIVGHYQSTNTTSASFAKDKVLPTFGKRDIFIWKYKTPP